MSNIPQPQADVPAKSFSAAFRAYRAEMWRQRRWVIPGLLLPGIGGVFVVYVPPLIISKLIHDFHGRIPATWAEIVPYIALLAAVWTLGEILWRLAFLCLNRGDANGMRNLYVNALSELLRKDISFFNDNFAGSLTKKAIGYGRGYELFVDTISFNILGNLIPLLFAVVILATLAPLLVVTLIGIITLGVLLILPAIKMRQRLVAEREAASNETAGHVADVIANISAVQAFAHEDHEHQRHKLLVGRYMDVTQRSWDFHVLHVDMLVAPLSILSNVIGLILAILLTDNAATTATVFVTFSYFAQSTRILFEFNRIYRNIENALTEAAEFTALLAEPPRLTEQAGAKPLRVRQGAIEFRHVDFAYGDNDDELLFQDFNLHIKAGEKIALVGHSGGGKTTVTKLLLRFVDVSGGQLLVDGQNIADGTLASLRQAIAYVPQDPAMFHRSIMENIRYGRLEASDKEVYEAARKAHATEFVDKLPHGFETLVGERGVKLSGGQRQRIAIARAILRDAPILVLDEATSALDSESEVLIQNALFKLMQGRTAIVIAHRLSTIQKMDRIIVLDNGRIAEQGSHKQLARQGGIYAKLWAHQSGGFIED